MGFGELNEILMREQALREREARDRRANRQRKEFLEQICDDLTALAYHDESRAVKVGGGPISETDVCHSWAR